MCDFEKDLMVLNHKSELSDFDYLNNSLFFDIDVNFSDGYGTYVKPYDLFDTNYRYVPFIYYISDLHLDVAKLRLISLDDIVKHLVDDIFSYLLKIKNFFRYSRNDIVISFLGDYSDDLNYSLEFFKKFDDELYRSINDKFDDDYDVNRFLKFIKIIIVSGNHDYINVGLNNPYDVDTYLNDVFSNIDGLHFNCFYLNDNYIEFDSFIILGGTGWAYKNPNFNSSNLVGPENYDLSYEKYHSDNLNLLLNDVLSIAKIKGKPVMCLSHYSIDDWISDDFDFNYHPVVFFNGHTHRNSLNNRGLCFEFSDNQIGNKMVLDDYIFKHAQLSPVINPYLDVEKFRLTSIDEIVSFYRYKSMIVSLKSLINYKTDAFYVMKYKNHYALLCYHPKHNKFFIINGGKFKSSNLLNFNSIDDIYNWFVSVVDILINSGFNEFNNRMVQLSELVKILGFSGKKHGLIVDLDYENHIMINPISKSLIVYNADQFSWYQGVIQIPKNQFGYLNNLFHMKIDNLGSNSNLVSYHLNLLKPLLNASINIDMVKDFLDKEDESYYYVDKHFNNYGLSRKYSDLSKLFDKNILVNNYDIFNLSSEFLLD